MLAHGDVALSNNMLNDYKVGKVYEYFLSGWLQEVYFLKTVEQQQLVYFIFKNKVFTITETE
jgi:hypothetical protein